MRRPVEHRTLGGLALAVMLILPGYALSETSSSSTADAPATSIGNTPAGGPKDDKVLRAQNLLEAPLSPSLSGTDLAVAEKIRNLVAANLGHYVSRNEDRAGLETFYRNRGFTPLWISGGQPTRASQEARIYLGGVGADGLDPADYPVPNFAGADPALRAEDDIRLSSSLLAFARHASTGRVSFTRVSGSIFYNLKFPEAEEVLGKLAVSTNIRAELDSYHPPQPGYKALKAKLAELRRLGQSGKVAHIPDGPTLQRGMEDARVPQLRKHLNLSKKNSLRYDRELESAVEKFQRKADIPASGMVDQATLARLNSGDQSKLAAVVIANMERWRWLPRDLGSAHVAVNIPDYTLKVFDKDKAVWSTKIIVGKPGEMATPLLSETLIYVTINPTWNVPPSIIRNEYLPALQSDSNALNRLGLKMSRKSDGSIRIYQPPGPRNALGRIRFNFPNKFLVYQHDTPNKDLFSRSERAYSHGCMRVQDPEKYAEVLLSLSQPQDRYTAERIRSLYGDDERTIRMKNPIAVHITYQTAFVDDAGHLQTRPDVYGRDQEILKLLQGKERTVADIPINRDYSSNTRSVRAQTPPRPKQRMYTEMRWPGSFRLW
jgi:murein L,D-transpeptidase YcbB/YkuD